MREPARQQAQRRQSDRPTSRRREQGRRSEENFPRQSLRRRPKDRGFNRRTGYREEHLIRQESERMRAERRAQLKRRRIRRRRVSRLCKGIAAAAVLAFLLPRAIGLASSLGQGILRLFVSPSGFDEHEIEAAGNLTGENAAADYLAVILPQGGVDAQVLERLRETWKDSPEAEPILEHPEQYPDALLELLDKRPETLSFVLHYPSQKNEKQTVDLSGETIRGTIPLLYQWDERWGYGRYGDNIVALAGCGPTCLSMVLVGLTGDASLHPGAVAAFSEENGYRTEGGTSWDLMTLGAGKLGITGEELPLDKSRMIEELRQGHPIICSMRPGDFTDTGHFIVITGYKDGAFVVHDPNSMENSRLSWTYEQINGQIKNLWAYSL